MSKFYDIRPLLKQMKKVDAKYGMIIGERSNGKTYSCKELAINGCPELDITGYLQTGEQFAYVRRYDDDFKGKRGVQLFDDMVKNGDLVKWSKGKWNDIEYYRGCWWLAKWDNNHIEKERDTQPCGFAFAISTMEHDKSTSYPNITKIIFDEFLTRTSYLPDEFVLFMNVVSTIVRQDAKVTIFMLGNTVNKYCPYFAEMGLTNVDKMEKGTIDTYDYVYEDDKELHLCIERTRDTDSKRSKPSDVYFAFNSPKLKMITKGDWEIASYPHKPKGIDIRPRDIMMVFFIIFGNDTLQCEVIQQETQAFIYIHTKTTPIQDENKDIIYSVDYDPRPNHRRKITVPQFDFERVILNLFETEKVFYQDNTVGEVVRNYINWCNTDRIV